MSHRLASPRVCSLAGRYDNHLPESTLSPQSGSNNLATGVRKHGNINTARLFRVSLVSARGRETVLRSHLRCVDLFIFMYVVPTAQQVHVLFRLCTRDS